VGFGIGLKAEPKKGDFSFNPGGCGPRAEAKTQPLSYESGLQIRWRTEALKYGTGEGIREPRGIPAVRLPLHDKDEVSTIYFERSSCHCDFPCQSRKGSSFEEFKSRNFAQRRSQSRFEIRAVSDQCYANCLKPREQGESTYQYQAKPEKVDAKSHKH